MKKIYLLSVLLLLVCSAHAQKHLWQRFGENPSGGQSSGQDVEIDGADNVYVLNGCEGPTIIGTDTIQPPYPGRYAWVGKFDKHGNKLWTVAMGSTGFDTPYDMVLDEFANVYIKIYFGSAGVVKIADTSVSVTGFPASLVKLDSAGNFQWLAQIPYYPSCGDYMAYSKGYLFTRTCSGIQRFNSTDGAQSGPTISNTSLTLNSAYHKGIATAPNGDILLSFSSEGMSVNGVPLPITPNAQGNGGNLHLLRIDTGMNVLSHKAYGSFLVNIGDYLNPITVDDSGYVYTFGVGNVNQAFFGNDTLTPFNILLDIVLLKMDSMLNPIKLMPLYRSGGHMVQDLLFANNGFYVVGRTGYTEFPNGAILPNSINGDNMVLKFSRTGQALWVNSSGYTNSASDQVTSITCGSDGTLYLSGTASAGNGTFGCDTNTNKPGMHLFAMRDYLPIDLPAVNPTYIREGYRVFFNAGLTDGELVSWNFGDGTPNSVQENPTHLYTTPGVFKVTLTTRKDCDVRVDSFFILYKGIQKVLPGQIANNQLQTIFIKGGFPFSTATVKLIKGATVLDAIHVAVVDSGSIQANFLLSNEPLGFYNVVVNAPGFTDTLYNGLEMVPENIRLPEVQIVANPFVLINAFYNYQIVVTNPGNVNQYGVPVYIGTNPKSVVANISNHIIRDSINQVVTAALGGDFVLANDSTTNDSALIAAFLIPVVPANSSEVIEFRLKTTSLGDRLMYVRLGEPIFDSAQLAELGLRTSCDFFADPLACLLDAAGEIPFPLTSCLANALSLGCAIGNIGNDLMGTRNRKGVTKRYVVDVFNLLSDIAGVATCSSGPFTPKDKINEFLIKFLGQSLNAGAAKLSGSTVSIPTGFTPLEVNIPGSCIDVLKKPLPEILEGNLIFKSVSSLDPNDKIGPIGNSPENYINDKNRMHYRIRFENVDTASAPASFVEVTDTLDATFFDISTLRFTGFGFTDSSYFLVTANRGYAQEIDLRPAKNTIVRVEVIADTTNYILTWRFYSLHPVTKEPVTVVSDGFLNPNITSPEGEGYVSYSIMPKANRPHLQQVSNTASIVFDNNSAIITEPWTNTIDKQKPSSQVLPMPAIINDTTFYITWSGTDPHSGIHDYDVFVTINDTLTYQLLNDTKFDSMGVKGSYGSTYKFWTIARDNVGNIEDAPAQPDVIVTLEAPLPVSANSMNELNVSIVPNPASNSVTVYKTDASPGLVSVTITGINGAVEMESAFAPNQKQLHINIEALPAGVHLVTLKGESGTVVKKLVKQ